MSNDTTNKVVFITGAARRIGAAIVSHLHESGLSDTETYQSEVNLMSPAWIKSLSSSLSRGVILLIDYGFPRHEYYHPQRNQGTLMCHYRHHSHSDPLTLTGLQDITTHVDFTQIAEAATNNGLHVNGFTNQATFLLSCGITDFAMESSSEVEQIKVSQQIQKLTMPHEMGELFKVIALTKEFDTPMMGFTMQNLLDRL